MRDFAQFGRIAVLLIAATFLFASPATADPPDVLHSFRFVPRHSTLSVTGGFAGVDLEYNLVGKFDLVTGYDYSPLAVYPPILIPRAEFENVRAYAIWNDLRAFAPAIPLSNFVDLESLDGTFRLGRPRELLFTGQDNQDMPFTLKATQHGRLLHLRGANDPSCCDFFHYQIDAYAVLRPFADFNWDGLVDRTDARTIMDNFGLAADATFDQGDADGDGDVDGNDFLAWQTQVGDVPEMAMLGAGFAADVAADVGGVPEPTTFILLLVGTSVFATLYRQRARR